jgi:Rrf2 family protein
MRGYQMSTNSRYAVSVHILTLLALTPDEPQTSEYIAASVNTHPAFIRRLLGTLRLAQLVHSQPGTNGGWQLTRDAATITLRDVYEATKEQALFSLHHSRPNPLCPVGKHIQAVLEETTSGAEQALIQELAQTSIAMMLQRVLTHV